MIRLAANISTMFTELPFADRIEAAAKFGFRAIECQFPYVVEPLEIALRLSANGMKWVLFNAAPGNAAAAERGIASLPGREPEFKAGLARVLEYVAATDCRRVHVMAGLLPPGAVRERHLETYVTNLTHAADVLAEAGVTVMIEAINTKVDVPGYLLDGTQLAVECIRAVNRPNIRLQYDVYHMQIMEGDLMRSVERLLPWIGHIQIADNPGRHEPGTGEIAFERLLRHIDAIGYEGYIGCEYVPASATVDGLGWSRPWLEGEKS